MHTKREKRRDPVQPSTSPGTRAGLPRVQAFLLFPPPPPSTTDSSGPRQGSCWDPTLPVYSMGGGGGSPKLLESQSKHMNKWCACDSGPTLAGTHTLSMSSILTSPEPSCLLAVVMLLGAPSRPKWHRELWSLFSLIFLLALLLNWASAYVTGNSLWPAQLTCVIHEGSTGWNTQSTDSKIL